MEATKQGCRFCTAITFHDQDCVQNASAKLGCCLPVLDSERIPDQPVAPEARILDAGYGSKGSLFSMLRVGEKVFVHVSVSEGYLVFATIPDSEAEVVKNAPADLIDQGEIEFSQRAQNN